MMRKLRYIAFSFFFVLMSCTDFLEVEPREQISTMEQFATYKGNLQVLSGAYLSTFDIMSDKFFVYADLLGGNSKFNPNNFGVLIIDFKYSGVYNFNDLAEGSDFSSFYESSNKNLNAINNLLNFIDAVPDATQEQKNQVKAEVYTLRALLHFNLVQVYGQTYNYSTNSDHKGIVLANKVFTIGADNPSRATVAETYTFIVNDLQKAIPLYSKSNALPGPNYSYFNPMSTKALLAKVALQKRDWELAASTANDVISNGGITLMSTANYVAQWEKTDGPVSEIIFEFSPRRDGAGAAITNTVAKFYKFISNTNKGLFVASNDLYRSFELNDVRKNNFKTIALPTETNTGPQLIDYYFTKKHQDNAGTPVIRLSEMYLIRAEANARLNNTTQALQDLNTIRNRAGIPAITSTGTILDEILSERRKELCFEGLYFFDLMRYNKNVVRGTDCISTLCNLTFPNLKFVLPIPQKNLDVNPLMKQNESY